MKMRLNEQMDMPTIRRSNLTRLFRDRSDNDVTGFSRLIGKSQSATSDLLHGRKSFGEKMARSIERNAKLPLGFLDNPNYPEVDGTLVMGFGATLTDAPRPNPPATGVIGDPIVEWEKPEDLPDDAYFLVSRYDVHASAGNGHVVYEELEHSLGQAFRMDWLRRKGLRGMALRCIYAKGDSMCPVICDGFSLVLDTDQTTVQDGKIYVIRYGDEVRVKYLHRRFDGGLIIRSENKLEFPDVEVKAEDMRHIEVLGRVVHVAGDY